MSYFRPKRIRWTKIFASCLRSLAGLLRHWQLLLLTAFFISPIGPHLRTEYTYEQRGSYRYMLECEYLGSRGFVTYQVMGKCPVFTILDARK